MDRTIENHSNTKETLIYLIERIEKLEKREKDLTARVNRQAKLHFNLSNKYKEYKPWVRKYFRKLMTKHHEDYECKLKKEA